jgi:hypothetical protein
MNSDFLTYLIDTTQRSLNSLALDDSTDRSDTAQLLLFICDVNDKLDVITLLFCVEVTKGTAGENL